ncbi:MAG: hypothetical protein IPO00_13930 [Betaproteobacteria bacterium]|nr:hypothetical protein [Betaproteobacteria bacterium]
MADSLAQYLDSLDRDRELPAELLVLLARFAPSTGIHNKWRRSMHHEERLRVLEDACTEPRSAADLLADTVPRRLDTHQVMFAIWETIAHLNRLEYAGRLVHKDGADGVIRYQRKN